MYNRDQRIEEMHNNKIKRWDNSSLSAQLGGLIHDAVALTIAILGQEKKSLATRDDYQEEIKMWIDWLYNFEEAKKEELNKLPEVDLGALEASDKLWDSKRQELYNQDGELDDINKQLTK